MAVKFADILARERGRPRHEHSQGVIQWGLAFIQNCAPAQAPGKIQGIVFAARLKDGIQQVLDARAGNAHDSDAPIASWRGYGADGWQGSYWVRSAFLRIITTRLSVPSPVLLV